MYSSDRRKKNLAQRSLDEDVQDSNGYPKHEDYDGERVTRYSDGSSVRHGSGPAGPMTYDENGEEC